MKKKMLKIKETSVLLYYYQQLEKKSVFIYIEIKILLNKCVFFIPYISLHFYLKFFVFVHFSLLKYKFTFIKCGR